MTIVPSLAGLQQGLMSPMDAAALISTGRPCCVAGDEALLSRLPRGRWIGGTIPYFMGEAGGTCTRDEIFVTELPWYGDGPRIMRYDAQGLSAVCTDGPEHGFTLLVLPAFSAVHESFAQEAPSYPEMFMRPLAGWISGIHLDDIARVRPSVFDGRGGQGLSDAGVAIHVPVDPALTVHMDIVNLFQQQPGPVIEFERGGFTAAVCRIDGQAQNLHDWLLARRHDIRLPLVADYCGALVNVSIKRLDSETRRVEFFAPVFADTPYRLACPVGDYVSGFDAALAKSQPLAPPVFCCNCLNNYVHGGLEGRRLPLHGPITFGEIGYQLLNQTLVYLSLVPA